MDSKLIVIREKARKSLVIFAKTAYSMDVAKKEFRRQTAGEDAVKGV